MKMRRIKFQYPKKINMISSLFTLLMILFGFIFFHFPMNQFLEDKYYDLLLSIGPAKSVSDKIVLITVDDNSLSNLNSTWPLDRNIYARVIKNLQAAKPAVLGIDILITEPKSEKGDSIFKEAVETSSFPIILAADFYQNVQHVGNSVLNSEGINLPIAGKSYGFINVHSDSDGYIREFLPFKEINDTIYYSFDLVLLSQYLKASLLVKNQWIFLGNSKISLNPNGQVPIYYSSPSDLFRKYSIYEISEGFFNPDLFKDKIIIIAPSFNASKDKYFVPAFRGKLLGGEIHAHILNMFLENSFIYRLNTFFSLLLALFTPVLFFFLFCFFKAYHLIRFLLFFAVYFLLTALFLYGFLVFLPVLPVLIGIICLLVFYFIYQKSIIVMKDQMLEVLKGNTIVLDSSENPEEQKPISVSKNFIEKYKLTKSESEIIVYLYQGLTAKEIAKKRFNSFTTVKKHIHNIYVKLGINTKESFYLMMKENRNIADS